MSLSMSTTRRAGFCAIIGRPNVGKSTLLNQILGQKLAVVTPKPQTTRNRILGIKNRPDAQIVFVDTPGVHRARSRLNRYMVEEALRAADECDVVLFMVDAPRAPAENLVAGFDPGPGNRLILEHLAASKPRRLLAINKIDLLAEKTALLPLIDGYRKILGFEEIVPCSAKSGDGVGELEDACASLLPEGEPLFPEEMLTDRAERFLAAELIREQAFLLCRDEVPYATAVTVESWEERPQKGDLVVEAVMHVERDSQKRIIVGEGGRMIREIGTRARAEIGRLLGCPVHLKLFVKVDPDWTGRDAALRRLGYS